MLNGLAGCTLCVDTHRHHLGAAHVAPPCAPTDTQSPHTPCASHSPPPPHLHLALGFFSPSTPPPLPATTLQPLHLTVSPPPCAFPPPHPSPPHPPTHPSARTTATEVTCTVCVEVKTHNMCALPLSAGIHSAGGDADALSHCRQLQHHVSVMVRQVQQQEYPHCCSRGGGQRSHSLAS